MTDKQQPEAPAKPIVWPAGVKDVTADYIGRTTAIIGARRPPAKPKKDA